MKHLRQVKKNETFTSLYEIHLAAGRIIVLKIYESESENVSRVTDWRFFKRNVNIKNVLFPFKKQFKTWAEEQRSILNVCLLWLRIGNSLRVPSGNWMLFFWINPEFYLNIPNRNILPHKCTLQPADFHLNIMGGVANSVDCRPCTDAAFLAYITKTRLFKYIENFTSKSWKNSDKELWYFSYFCSKHRL